MTVQHRLHLRRRHLEAVDLHHLLRAVGEVDPAFGLEPADVAGAVPAVDEGVGRRLVRQVAGHDRRAPGLELADLAGPDDPAAVEVGDPELDVRRRHAGRVEPPGGGVGDRVDGDHRQLAGAIRRQPPDARALGDRNGHALGDRGRAPHDVAQRREVVVLEARMVRHGQRDGGDRHLQGHALGRDAAQHLVEVEPAVQPDRGAGLRGGEQVEEAEDVRRRRRHLEPVVGAEAQGRAPVRRRPADRRVRVADRLGEPGRARAEDEDHVVGGACLGARGPATAVGQRRLERGRVVEVGHAIAAQAVGEQRGRGAVGDGVAGTRGQLQGVVDLGGLPRRAQEHGRGADLADRVDRDHELRTVRHHHRNAVARTDAAVHQVPGEGVAEAVEVPERPAVVTGPDGIPIAVPVRGPLQPPVHERRHRKHCSRIRRSTSTRVKCRVRW